ncbi:hypothetical protein BT69DRAFT_1293218 [Atractiella rhizophila]|nr:hypothetical protein BT69DRAFT_1293218 [Atractiella rhizophila]
MANVFLYLYKYLYKGVDQARYQVQAVGEELNPVKDYIQESYPQDGVVRAGRYEEIAFSDETEGEFPLQEAVENFVDGPQLRLLFVQLIIEDSPALLLWERFKLAISADYLR